MDSNNKKKKWTRRDEKISFLIERLLNDIRKFLKITRIDIDMATNKSRSY